MTLQIAAVFIVIAIAILLFVTERLRVDLVALLVLAGLVLAGLVTPDEALSGFSNPAVITVWAVFILSGGLTQSGVANTIGNRVFEIAGNNPIKVLLLIMVTAALLSSFMNNVGVAALLLPVAMGISARSKIPPSQLLLPLAIGCLLGGMTTLIGTPPNILASDALREAGLEPFTLFDFAPIGTAILAAGIAYILLAGRHLLPVRDTTRELGLLDAGDLEDTYGLRERLHMLRIPPDSSLAGMTVEDSQLGSMLGLTLIAIIRNGRTISSPGPHARLYPEDKLLVIGRAELLDALRKHQVDTVQREQLTAERATASGVRIAEVELLRGASIIGKSSSEVGFRQQFGLNILVVKRDGTVIRGALPLLSFREGDILVVEGQAANIERLGEYEGFKLETADEETVPVLNERLLLVRIPEQSSLAGSTLLESRLGERFGLTVLKISREETEIFLPKPEESLLSGDTLLVQGTEQNLNALRALEKLESEEAHVRVEDLVGEDVGLSEVVLSPHATLTGKTLEELNFRDKFGLNVVAIWRAGRAYRFNLADMPLNFGDALLVFGSRNKIRMLASEPDFILLTAEGQTPLRPSKAPIAVGIMAAVLIAVLLDFLPIAMAAVIGATLMILSGVLTMEEAYRFIDWRAVFLIAGMLPLGAAMQNSGAAQLLADNVMSAAGSLGPLALISALFVLSVLASQVMPNPAVVVLMAPIALASAANLGFSPSSLIMTIAIAASASFLSPVSHPANILVMGPGGYRFMDYVKIGFPLTLLVLLITLLLLPIVWPLQ